MATRRLAQGVFSGDATRHMGPRSVLCSRYVLELEIFLRRADDLFRRHYHLLYLGGMDRFFVNATDPLFNRSAVYP